MLGLAILLFAVSGCARTSAPVEKSETELAAERARAAGRIVPVPPHCPFKQIPKLKPIGGTAIYYAVETTGDLFWYDGKYYWVYRNQWFRSRHWGSDWEYADLVPGEFLRIPPEHEKSGVVRWHPAYVRAYGYRLQGGGRFEHNWWNPSSEHTPEWLAKKDRERREFGKPGGGKKEPEKSKHREPVPDPGLGR